jgi:hypothetical protein
MEAVRSGAKIMGVSYFGGPLPMDIDRLRAQLALPIPGPAIIQVLSGIDTFLEPSRSPRRKARIRRSIPRKSSCVKITTCDAWSAKCRMARSCADD